MGAEKHPQTLDECAEEREKFEMLTEASPDCIKLFDLGNKLLFMSKGGLEEHGFKVMEEALGFDWTETVIPEQRAEIQEKIRESIEGKKIVSLDVKHLPKYANREWCHLLICPVFADSGDVKYFVGISRDISDRKRSEEQMMKYIRELELFNKVTVDRELKMAELKKENAALKNDTEKKD